MKTPFDKPFLIGILIMLVLLALFGAGFICGSAYAQEPNQPPQTIPTLVPEGWTDMGPYYYGISTGGAHLIIKFRAQEILKDKLDFIPFLNPAEPRAPRKNPVVDYWKKFSAAYIEQAVRDVLKINGITDYAAESQMLFFPKNVDHYWEECPQAVNEWVATHQDTMCNLQQKVMAVINKAFCKDCKKKPKGVPGSVNEPLTPGEIPPAKE